MEYKKKGFTLIELLFSLTIVGIILGITLPKYANFTERKRLESDAKKMVDTLELARKKAVSSDIAANCLDFAGYQVNITQNSYSLEAICEINQTLQSYSFSPTVTVTSGNLSVQFDAITGLISKDQSYIITLHNNAINKNLNIDVNISGVITMGEVY